MAAIRRESVCVCVIDDLSGAERHLSLMKDGRHKPQSLTGGIFIPLLTISTHTHTHTHTQTHTRSTLQETHTDTHGSLYKRHTHPLYKGLTRCLCPSDFRVFLDRCSHKHGPPQTGTDHHRQALTNTNK